MMKFINLISMLGLVILFPGLGTSVASEGQFHQVNLDVAVLHLPKSEWKYGVSEHLLGESIPLFQNIQEKKLVGNLQSVLKITPRNEIFHPVKTLERECSFMKQVLDGIDIKDSTYLVHFEAKKGPLPQCWVEKRGPHGVRISAYLATARTGRTKDFSYMLHTFTFNFPLDVERSAMEKLANLFTKVQFENEDRPH